MTPDPRTTALRERLRSIIDSGLGVSRNAGELADDILALVQSEIAAGCRQDRLDIRAMRYRLEQAETEAWNMARRLAELEEAS